MSTRPVTPDQIKAILDHKTTAALTAGPVDGYESRSVADPPSVTFDPVHGPVGTKVIVTLSEPFLLEFTEVKIGDVPCRWARMSTEPNRITFPVPAGAITTAITVKWNSDVSLTSAGKFIVDNPSTSSAQRTKNTGG